MMRIESCGISPHSVLTPSVVIVLPLNSPEVNDVIQQPQTLICDGVVCSVFYNKDLDVIVGNTIRLTFDIL